MNKTMSQSCNHSALMTEQKVSDQLQTTPLMLVTEVGTNTSCSKISYTYLWSENRRCSRELRVCKPHDNDKLENSLDS